MSEWLGFGSDLPWWGWMFLVIGIVAFVSVVAALFFPDWADDDYTVGFEAPPGSDQFVEWTSTFLNVPIYDGGEVTLLQNGDRFFPAMLNAIREAKDSVHFETYIFSPDEIGRQFIDALKERAQAGVEVRLLLDAFGAIGLKKRHRQELRSAGVSLSRFRPLALRNLARFYRRAHRRAIVIDGKLAFTGGAAVSRKWKGDVRTIHEWRDSMIQVSGQLVSGIYPHSPGIGCTARVK